MGKDKNKDKGKDKGKVHLDSPTTFLPFGLFGVFLVCWCGGGAVRVRATLG